jgi:hypothetical protein
MRLATGKAFAAAAAVVALGGVGAYHAKPQAGPRGCREEPPSLLAVEYGPQGAEAARLDRIREDAAARHAANRLLARELADGRVELPAAVDELLRTNAAAPDFLAGMQTYFPAQTLEASAARNLISRADRELEHDPARRAEVVARLEAEYARAYGPRTE